MQWGFLSQSFPEILRLLVAFGRFPRPWLGFGRAPAGQGQRRGTEEGLQGRSGPVHESCFDGWVGKEERSGS